MPDRPLEAEPTTSGHRAFTLGLALAAVGTIALALAVTLEFSCDDAFITFRYVQNARDGHGLVWNAPPYAPVEGYTGFLWALLLWVTWSCTGVAPPAAANWLSLGFGIAQLAVIATAALAICTRDRRRIAPWLGVVVFAVAVSNRSFLQWWTSGLETALFHLLLLAWVLWAFRRRRDSGRWLATWSMLAALAALTRPDGLLFAAATGALATAEFAARRRSGRATLLGLAPLILVAAHVGWRRWFYGEWLPNTYHAKVIAPWPEAGLRYLGSYALENGLWLLPAFALPALPVLCVRLVRRPARDALARLAPAAAVAAVALHSGYYVLQVGGDHFEYRVLCHLAPLCGLAIAAIVARGTTRAWPVVFGTAAFGLATSAAWMHLAWTRDLPAHGFERIADRAPAALRPLMRWYDRQQAWLLFHNIGLRCAHHARILERFREPFPGRLTVADAPDPFPSFATGAVGIVGWNLPGCAILDGHGLNDWVVARTPLPEGGTALDADVLRPLLHRADGDGDGWLDRGELRAALAMLSPGGGGEHSEEGADFLIEIMLAICARERPDAMTLAESEGIGDMLSRARSMAHERHAPRGYFEMLDPNVRIVDGVAVARPRATPLTAARIQAIERTWRAWIDRGAPADDVPTERDLR